MIDDPKTDEAIRFLDWLRPAGPWLLSAKRPDGPFETRSCASLDAARRWIEARNGHSNLYVMINPAMKAVDKKAKKEDVAEVAFLHVDLDVKQGPFEEGLARIRETLADFEPRPSGIIHSGGGYWAFWRLNEPVFVGGDANRIAESEAYNRQLETALGGDHCRNVDRVCRLPGTINLPDEPKRKRGRTASRAYIVELSDVAYPLHDFTPAPVEAAATTKLGTLASGVVRKLDDLDTLAEWGIGEADRYRAVILHGEDPVEPGKFGGDRSPVVFDVCCNLLRRGVPDDLIAGILTDDTWGISAHVRDQKRPVDYAWRQIGRARQTIDADGEPFQSDKDGKPYVNQHNIRLAMSKLGVSVRHDTFAGRLLVSGLDGCGPHLDDAALDRLWLDADERFRFRPPWDFFVKVVVDTARRAPFYPVLDYIGGLCWDGVPRLDQWLPSYGGADDTPYTRAVGALMLIAAVRRVRQPGVKFDEMLVMESRQGTNKSSALRILATRDDWFLDDLPLNAESKMVIERLSGRWITEAAELKGMRKGEVEHLKGFLSRQQDTARMSYARMPVIVPRQCVIFGTTNSEQYLRDLTGNRRFWPVRIEAFDLERLRVDVDQLWAEASVREAAGESIRLDPALWGDAAQEQDSRRVEDPFTLALATAVGEHNGKISSEAVFQVLRIQAGRRTQDDNARVGDAMRELGFQRKKMRFGGSPEWGYARGTEAEQRYLIVIASGLMGERPDDPY